MRAADTNVLVRLLLLRSVYRFPRADVLRALRSLLGLPQLHVEAADALQSASHWCAHGMDFADALHLATARDCAGMVKFDRDVIKAAARIGAGNVAEP